MSNIDSGRLIAHIDEAKGWLDKAKEEYCESNAIRGDLHLNLAQAEVKCAWELSHRLDVSKIDGVDKAEEKPRWQRYILPAAAVLVVVLMSGAVLSRQWLPWSGDNGDGISIANRLLQPGAVKSLQISPDKQSDGIQTEAGSNSMDGRVIVSEPVPSVSKETALKVSRIHKSTDGLDKSRINQAGVQRTPGVEENITAVSNSSANGRTEGGFNAAKSQPVSGITIDEEALTKEASKSLRLGK